MADAHARWGDYDRSDPFPLFADLAARAPVHRVVLQDGHEAWLVVRYDEARAALGDPRLSKDMQAALAAGPEIVDEGLPGPAFARHMLSADPPDHTRLRQLVAARFTHAAVAALEPRIEEIVGDLLDAIAARGPEAEVDLMGAFAFPMPFTVICELLGIPPGHREVLGASLALLLRPLTTPGEVAEARAASRQLAATFGAVIEAKEAHPGDDLVSDLVREQAQGRLDRIELQSTLFNLIVAGHETTTNLLGNAVLALFRDPALRARVVDDLDRLPQVIEELLRHDGPAQHATFRFATEPVDLGGVTVPAGAQVLVCLAAANRDPRRYDEPHLVDLDRAGPRHLAFGHGIHHCLGAGLARVEARAALGALLRRFPDLQPATDLARLRWDRGDGVVLRGLSALPVRAGAEATVGAR